LKGLTSAQDFILELSPEEFLAKRAEVKSALLKKTKQDWIARFKRDTTEDYVIGFQGYDEEIHENINFDK
jgi:hypothetical protein